MGAPTRPSYIPLPVAFGDARTHEEEEGEFFAESLHVRSL